MINYNSQLQTNNSSLEEIITQLNNLPDAGAAEPVLQDKTVTPTTSKQTITADSGYDGLDTVTVNAMPTATQATPSITINTSTGLITATATQTAGYVSAGTKSDTEQLTVQAAQTITPGTSNKTIAAGRYLTGTQTIKGDANLVASNIVSGKTIFGVSGTAKVGNDTSDATAAAEDIMLGETAYIASGKITGTFTLEQELNDQDSLVAQLQTLVTSKAAPASNSSIYQDDINLADDYFAVNIVSTGETLILPYNSNTTWNDYFNSNLNPYILSTSAQPVSVISSYGALLSSSCVSVRVYDISSSNGYTECPLSIFNTNDYIQSYFKTGHIYYTEA